MKAKELKERDIEELNVVVEDLKATIHKNSMDVSMNKSSNVHLISEAKRDLARVLTVIREMELKK